jgi:hypothetical protein
MIHILLGGITTTEVLVVGVLGVGVQAVRWVVVYRSSFSVAASVD